MSNRKILLLTTYYPPDTAISAVRPYMLAKYLSRMGYEVTVLRSGEINAKADDSNFPELDGVRVISYLGWGAPAERFKRGETIEYRSGKSRISFMPEGVRAVLSKTYHAVFSFLVFSNKLNKAKVKFSRQKAFLDRLSSNGELFDVVFSTYGELENIYGGEYAAKLFNCKYILDFRDLLAQQVGYNIFEYLILKRIQSRAIKKADIVTAVSEGMTSELSQSNENEKDLFHTLYNGYESASFVSGKKEIKQQLVLCYTGQLYSGKRDASPIFRALLELQDEAKIALEKVSFDYAGSNYDDLRRQAATFGVERIIENHGYLGRSGILDLQSNCDIFVVLSWNTKSAHGILTGKLYEGIRCEKPILAIVSGNEANSELKIMNEKYQYGLCYEAANSKNDFKKLKEWIYEAYQRKVSGLPVVCTAKPEFYTDFRYDHLAKELDAIITGLFAEDNI